MGLLSNAIFFVALFFTSPNRKLSTIKNFVAFNIKSHILKEYQILQFKLEV